MSIYASMIAASNRRFSLAAGNYLNRLQTAGLRVGIYDAANARLIDRLVSNGGNFWPDSGAFNAMAGYLFPSAGTLIPIHPNHNAGTLNAFVTGDWNAVTGLKGDGSTKFVNSNRNKNSDEQNDNSLGAYISEIGTRKDLEALFGVSTAVSGQRSLLRTSTPALVLRACDANNVFQPLDLIVGMHSVTRNVFTGSSYRVGGTDGTITASSVAPVSESILIFARNAATPSNHVHHRLPFYHIGPNLNGTGELAELDTILTDWQTNLANA